MSIPDERVKHRKKELWRGADGFDDLVDPTNGRPLFRPEVCYDPHYSDDAPFARLALETAETWNA